MTTSKVKRYGIPAALVAGGVTLGAVFSPIGIASADETDGDATDTESNDSGQADSESKGERRSRWRGRFGAKVDAVTEALGLTAEEVGDGLDAGKSLADLAAEQGVPVEQLHADLVAAANQELDEAVANGDITAERADRIRENLDERINHMINRTPPDVGPPGRRHHRHHHHGRHLDELSEILGLTEDEIRAGLADGKSLAELGEEQGVSAEELADAIMASAVERIDEAVEGGRITAERAAEAKEHLEDHVDHAITREHEGRGPWGHGRHRHFGGSGHGDGADGGVEESSFSA